MTDFLCLFAVTFALLAAAAVFTALRAKIVSREKARFLALMSHEIRTPMTGILGMIELMKDEGLTNEERADFLNTVSACSKTLLNTLNDVLDVSRLEEGTLEIGRVNFDLHAVLNNAANILARMAQNKGLSLSVVIDGNVPQQACGDPVRLQQIVTNLMDNAIKFTSRGGVTVHCAFQDKAAKPLIRVEVRDTGIGIGERNIRKLFKGFSQADDLIERRFGGTGLGLSIAKDLLLLMGGRVGVRSVPGEGSTFWFELPYLTPVAAAAAEEADTELLPLEILLAEDNKVNQQVVLRLLNNKGHKVSIADDGETVVRMAQEKAFDMILMDMNMPVKSGIDAAREIRALGGTYATLPIIALTANVVDEYIKKCYAAGMNAHVAKPFSPKELYRAMSRYAPPHAVAPPGTGSAPVVAGGERLNDNLQEIRRQLGPAYLNELIGNSLKESVRLLKAARGSFAGGDHAALQHAAHDLKNVSGLIGLHDTSHYAEMIEMLCRNEEFTALPDMMKDLVRDAEREIRKMERARGPAGG